MKLLALALLAPLTASAATELDCIDRKAGPDYGYYTTIKNLNTAVVTSQSIAGPRPVANMKCTLPHSMPRPDRPHMVAICTDYSRIGNGWMLTIDAEANGATSARLESDNGKSPRRVVAEMDCRVE